MAKTRLNLILNVFITLFLVINSQETDKRVLNYYHIDDKIYSIEENEANFKILIKQNIKCDEAPCIPPILEEQNIENEEVCYILRYLFDNIFEDSDSREKSIVAEDLTFELKLIILNIIEKIKNSYTLEYEILNNHLYNNKYKNKGYTYEMEDESVIYTIAMGQMPSSGYSIDIKKIKIKGNNASIYVTEKVPGNDKGEDSVLTYPIVQVKFNHLPSSIEVINYETGEYYESLI